MKLEINANRLLILIRSNRVYVILLTIRCFYKQTKIILNFVSKMYIQCIYKVLEHSSHEFVTPNRWKDIG